ncbi:MAG: LL-diaminopimelate aminotransferase [Maribacter sp.]|jgi:LL-diaminopimelate aminotransferase
MIKQAINIKSSDRLGEVKEYYFSQKLREIAEMNQAGKNVLNLGIGSPDLAPHPSVISVLHDHSSNLNNHAYQSYKGIPELRNAFSNWYKKYFNVQLNAEKEILPLMGSKEGIMHISMSFLNEGDEVLVPNPGYPAYAAVTKLAGGKIRNYDLIEHNNWLPNLEELSTQNLSKVKIMWVNYPNMPTGAMAQKSFFKELISFGKRHNIIIINDNPYAFILNDDPISILGIKGAKEIAMELNSLSKAQNMAGWRIGVLAGKKEWLDTVLRFKSNMDSGMFKPLQLAAVKALELNQDWYDNLNTIYKKRQLKVFEIMELLNCKYDKNQKGLFVWAKIPTSYKSGFELSDEILYNKNVFITPGGIFGSNGDRYIRISLCSKVEIFEETILRIVNN